MRTHLAFYTQARRITKHLCLRDGCLFVQHILTSQLNIGIPPPLALILRVEERKIDCFHPLVFVGVGKVRPANGYLSCCYVLPMLKRPGMGN